MPTSARSQPNSSAAASGTGARNLPPKESPSNVYESPMEELEPVRPTPSYMDSAAAVSSSSTGGGAAQHYRRGSAPAFAPRGSKDLPAPPIQPVMPDFGDLVSRRRPSIADEMPGNAAGVKRKTSVVKKFKERVVKA